MRLRIVLALVLAVLLRGTASAKPQLWDVYCTSDQPFASVALDRFESDTLYLKWALQTVPVHQDSIRSLVRRNKSQSAIGLVAGLGVGVFAASRMRSPTGIAALFAGPATAVMKVLVVVVGVALGGAAGASAGADAEFRLDKMNPGEKREFLRSLFPAHRQRPKS